MWAETRWESKIKSVEPMRYQGAAVREALIEVRDHTKDSAIKAEAQSLSEEVGSYRFSTCTVVWYDMLSAIQHVSKLMQSPGMDADIVVGLLKKTERGLQSYRASGFVTAQMAAKDLCEEMNVEGVLKGPIVKPLNWSGGWGRVSRRRSLFGPFLVLLRTRSILILLCENTRVFFVDVNISLLPPNSACRVFCSIFAKRKRGTWPFSFR
jgi:hypothetical protein